MGKKFSLFNNEDANLIVTEADVFSQISRTVTIFKTEYDMLREIKGRYEQLTSHNVMEEGPRCPYCGNNRGLVATGTHEDITYLECLNCHQSFAHEEDEKDEE